MCCRRDGGLALRLIACAFVLAACDHNRKALEAAKHSAYDADFVVVYNAALEATRAQYSNLDDRPGPGRISTAWHEMTMVDTTEELANPQTISNASGAGASTSQSGSTGQAAASASGTPAPTMAKARRFYIRFDVTVTGGRPWRVKVVGHASSWEAGAAMPVELHGAAKPGWLEGRTNSLRLAIHERLRAHAVPLVEDAPGRVADSMPKLDPTVFAGVPAAAAQLLAHVRLAVLERDYDDLRTVLASDVVWSDGAIGGAAEALAVWRADPTILDAMKAALQTCTAEAPARVRCASTIGSDADRRVLVVEQRGAQWLVTSFVTPQ